MDWRNEEVDEEEEGGARGGGVGEQPREAFKSFCELIVFNLYTCTVLYNRDYTTSVWIVPETVARAEIITRVSRGL